MASRGIQIGLVLLALVSMLLSSRVTGQSTSACTNAITSLAPCINYVSGNSSTPSSSCCLQLASVVQGSPQCLCQVLNASGVSLGFTINQTLALSLPGACNVQTPSISQCQAVAPATSPISAPPEISPAPKISPATSPAAATAGSPTETSNETPEPTTTTTTPSASSTPAATGSKTIPSTTGSSGGSGTVKAPVHFLVFVGFVVAFASTVSMF